MIIKTKVETSKGGLRTAYYKYMGSDGRAVPCGKSDAVRFPLETAEKVLSHLKQINHRFAAGELDNG